MALIVQKFGGTSVADPDRMRAVAGHVARCRRRGDDVALVVSAMGKETDELLRMAAEFSTNSAGRELDMLITVGERKAISLMCMALHNQGVMARSYTGSQAGFETDTNHQNAKIKQVNAYRIKDSLDEGVVPVIAGAQGVSIENDITFLGRGGSDTTAVALAHALGADLCELYTDVSGVFSADPSIVPTAVKMSTVTFDELLEMTASGCPKPAMRSVEVAHNYQVPLHVRSAFTWESGTMVVEQYPNGEELMEQPIIRAVTSDTSESKITLAAVPDKPGVSGRIFRTLATAGINLDMIVQNVSDEGLADISFTVPSEQFDQAVDVLNGGLVADLGGSLQASKRSIGKVSVVGAAMKSNPGVAATMFETLAEEGVNIEMISTSAIRISCVIAVDQVDKSVQLLHKAFGLEG